MDWLRKQGSVDPKVSSLLEADAQADVSFNTIITQRSLLDGGAGIETLLSHPSRPFANLHTDSSANIKPNTLDALKEGSTLEELVDRSPDDVLTVLKELAVAKFGTFTAKDSHVLKAFKKYPMLTRGCESPDDPFWEENWKDVIAKRVKKVSSYSPCEIGWEQAVTLGAYVVSFKDIAKREKGDLIKLLLQKSSAGAASKDIWEFPAIRAVINYHWEHWAKRLFNLTFYVYLVWIIAFGCYLTVYIESSKPHFDSPDPEVSNFAQGDALGAAAEADFLGGSEMNGERDSDGRIFGSFSSHAEIAMLTYVFNLVCLAFMLPFGIEEYYTLLAQRRDWFHLRNILDLGAISLQIVIFMCHLTDSGLTKDWFGALLALQAALLYIRLLRFIRILGEGTTFFDTAVAVIYDMRYWLIYIIFTGVCASFCFGALYKPDEEFHSKHENGAFKNVENSLVTTFQIIFGNFESDYIFDAKFHWLSFFLFFTFQILMTITVLNLLIAAMSESYSEMGSEKNVRYYRGRALVIDELSDLRLPNFLFREVASYVHFIIVENQERQPSTSAEASLKDQQASIDDLRKEVKDISAKLDRLLRAMDAQGPSPGTSRPTIR